MNRTLKFSFGVLFITSALGGAGEPPGNIDDLPSIDVVAYFYETGKDGDAVNRVARHFFKEFETLTAENPYKVIYRTDSSGEGFRIEPTEAGFRAEIEIVKRDWEIDRPLKIPLIFFIYSNNYKLEAVLRFYNRNKSDPESIKIYKIKGKGPCVYQIFENNPYDGGLILSYGQQKAIEYITEYKLAKKISMDMYLMMQEFEG